MKKGITFDKGKKVLPLITAIIGLGLAIAKEIIEAHEGEISIKSTVDVGTEVMINLPVKN